jgi:hypothetical protein
MYPSWIYFGGLGILLVWIVILSSLVLQQRKLYRVLQLKGEGDLDEVLQKILHEVASFDHLKQQTQRSLQKISLMRYNPYRDTGGDQSFSIALLNEHGDGFVITSLHARAGTRVFAKEVMKGKEVSFPFSDEERQVIKTALHSS